MKLEGWSEYVMGNIDDYDNVFEMLRDRYASKVQKMAPEIFILGSIASRCWTRTMSCSLCARDYGGATPARRRDAACAQGSELFALQPCGPDGQLP